MAKSVNLSNSGLQCQVTYWELCAPQSSLYLLEINVLYCPTCIIFGMFLNWSTTQRGREGIPLDTTAFYTDI